MLFRSALLPAELPHFAARHLLRRRYAGGDEALLRDQCGHRGHGIPRNEAHRGHQQCRCRGKDRPVHQGASD